MSVRLGINPLIWTNDDMPSLGEDISLSECLAQGKQAGFSGFELGNKFPRTAEPLRSVLQTYGLSLVSGWFSGRLLSRSLDDEIAAIKPHLELLKIQGARVAVYCETSNYIHGERLTPLSHRPMLAEGQWQPWCERLTMLARYCLSRGVRLAYHHHMGTVVETEADINKLMGNTGEELGLLLDTGHLIYAGGDILSVCERHRHRICHVHCKDVRANVLQDAKNRNLSFLSAVLNGVFTVPGDGSVDYRSFLATLKDIDYQGWLVVEAEQDPVIADPLTYATLGASFLKRICAEAGLRLW